MSQLWVHLVQWLGERQDEGQGLVEYALILVLVSVVAFAALTVLGTQVSTILSEVSSMLGT